MTTHEPLDIGTAVDLATIIGAAQRTAPVARLMTDGEVCYGTARSIGDTRGAFLARDTDVRDAHLRVTTRAGWEAFWPISELLGEVRSGEFVVDYAPPTGA